MSDVKPVLPKDIRKHLKVYHDDSKILSDLPKTSEIFQNSPTFSEDFRGCCEESFEDFVITFE